MRGILVALLAAAAILAAGCGSSSKDTAGTTTSATTQTTATASTETTLTDTTSTDATSTDTTSPPTSLGGLTTAAGLSAGCLKVANMSKQFSEAIGSSTGDAQKDLQKTAEAYKAFAAQAPEEIRGAFTTLADAFAKYADALKGVDLSSGKVPDAATVAKIAKATQSLSGSSLATASAQITAWVNKNCSSTG